MVWKFQVLEVSRVRAHMEKVGKKQLLLSCQISPLFISQRCKMIATNGK
jgi:hypothetical protein